MTIVETYAPAMCCMRCECRQCLHLFPITVLTDIDWGRSCPIDGSSPACVGIGPPHPDVHTDVGRSPAQRDRHTRDGHRFRICASIAAGGVARSRARCGRTRQLQLIHGIDGRRLGFRSGSDQPEHQPYRAGSGACDAESAASRGHRDSVTRGIGPDATPDLEFDSLQRRPTRACHRADDRVGTSPTDGVTSSENAHRSGGLGARTCRSRRVAPHQCSTLGCDSRPSALTCAGFVEGLSG